MIWLPPKPTIWTPNRQIRRAVASRKSQRGFIYLDYPAATDDPQVRLFIPATEVWDATVMDHSMYARTPDSGSSRSPTGCTPWRPKWGPNALTVRSPVNTPGAGKFQGLFFADSADFTLGTSDFHIKGWFTFDDISALRYIAGQCAANGANASISWYMERTAANKIRAACVDSGGTEFISITSTTTVAVQTQYWVEFRRIGTAFALAIGGASEATATSSTAINDSSSGLGIGRLGEYVSNTHFGHIQDFIFIVGRGDTFALPTTAIVPLAAPTVDQYASYTKLLVDASAQSNGSTPAGIDVYGHTPTYVGGAQCLTNDSVFGGGSSLYFNGSGQFLQFPDSADWAFGTNHVSLDWWAKADTGNTGTRAMLNQTDLTGGLYAFQFYQSSGNFSGFMSDGTSFPGTGNAGAIGAGWRHYAVTFDNYEGNYLSYHNHGVYNNIYNNIPRLPLKNSNGILAIGAFDAGAAQTWKGWMDQIRITVGMDRYPRTTITVPSAVFLH